MNSTILRDDRVSEMWQEVVQQGTDIVGGRYTLQGGHQRGNLTEVLKCPGWRRMGTLLIKLHPSINRSQSHLKLIKKINK